MSRTAVAAAAEEIKKHFVLPSKFEPAVRLELLVHNGHNARRRFDPVALEELAGSIREQGVIEPLIVRPITFKRSSPGVGGSETVQGFEVVAGERRSRAAQLAGLSAVPCVIREYSDADVLELTLVENIQREALGPLEEANGFKTLLAFDKTRYSAAYIAQKIGRTEKYVWDTLRLLNLIPELVEHLETGRITRSHANALSRLKPDQQKAIAHPETGGLFVPAGRELEGLDETRKPSKFDGLKARSVKELEAYIADHVRFDPGQAAKMAPLEFGETERQILEAQQKPGRGAKVVAIHFGHFVQESARADERTFGSGSWKRADGQQGSKRCEQAVLGVVAVGEGQGQAFAVCVAKDKCDVHWKQERKDRERSQKLRSSGRTKQAEARERKVEEERKAREAKEAAEVKRFEAARPVILSAVAAAVRKRKPSQLADFLLTAVDGLSYSSGAAKRRALEYIKPKSKADDIVRAAALVVLAGELYGYSAARGHFAKRAKAFGVDLNKILAASAKEEA